MKKLRTNIALILVSHPIITSCTEEYTAGTENFENDLVVEATLTNELKKQEIKLSHTFKFEDSIILASNATVQVVENQNTIYDFIFNESDSAYLSNETFQVLPEKEYQLKIKTQNGQQYSCESQTLPPSNQVNVVAKTGISKNERGLRIEANNYDANSNSGYYRYEYKETYQVTLPYYGPLKAVEVTEDSLTLEPRDDPYPICYNNIKSKRLIFKKTTDLAEDRVSDFLVAFRSIDDYAIAEKYSILVKQYVESPEAYAFYKTLDKISSTNGNNFSALQPGFVKGNIYAKNDPAIKVVGYFDVASVSTKRIFTKFTDYFHFGPLPPYFVDCDPESLNSTEWDFVPFGGFPEARTIRGYLKDDTKVFYKLDSDASNSKRYLMVKNICGTCDRYSTHVKPDFW